MLGLKLHDKIPCSEIDQEKNKDNRHHRIHTETKVEMGRTYSKNDGNRQSLDQTLHRVATKEREEIKRTTKQKMARRHNKERGNHLDQESNRQKPMEDIDGGLHPAVDGPGLGEGEDLGLRLKVLVRPLYLQHWTP